MKKTIAVIVLALTFIPLASCQEAGVDGVVQSTSIAEGWASNSINAVIFRRNSVVSHGDTQYVAFYDPNATVVLAKRTLGTADWEMKRTRYTGGVADAHNSISIMVDGTGFLHVAWDQHGNSLHYCRSVEPGSLDLGSEMPMTGQKELKVTYPEFYRLPDGNLLFLYRDGSSGNGNLMINYYDANDQIWFQLQDGLLNGEGQRNAYWQMAIDTLGTIHLSWVWRETSDVATNHDLCYARSMDGGITWLKSTGEEYQLPITAGSAEYAWRIPQRSELINQTSMCADSNGRPYIATYWRPEGTLVPQYHLVYHDGEGWNAVQVSQRTTPFTLSGGGTKRIPISRPQIVADANGITDRAYMLFRDIERDDRVSLAVCEDLRLGEWRICDLTDYSVSQWEPSYDTELWAMSRQLHVFVQNVDQGDGETLMPLSPQPVSILEWRPEWRQTKLDVFVR